MGLPEQAPVAEQVPPPVVQAPVPPAARAEGPDQPGTGEGGAAPRLSPRRLADRVVTVALLVYGALSIMQAVPSYLDATLELRTMGVEAELSDPAGARLWGVVAVVVLALGWAGTALLSWRRARRGRLAFWVPLVGGVVFNLLAAFLVVIPLVSDPAVAQAVMDLQGNLFD
jgi:hypothetical protein